MNEAHPSFFAASRLTLAITLLILFGLGLGIRLYDLTDLPLDFHPTRQLLSALKARGMFYQGRAEVPEWQRQMAVQQWKSKAEIEPEVFERLVAYTYGFTGDQLWVARIYSSVFWVIGGIFLFLLVRNRLSPDGAVIATAYYLFFPYAIMASRSFQPDPLMVMLILSFWWAVDRWASITLDLGAGRAAGWAWALLAGLLGGLAIFIKLVGVFFVVGAGLATVLARLKPGELLRNRQVWAMAALGILPAGLYLIYGILLRDFLGRQFSGRFIPGLLLSPLNYLQWATQAGAAAGGIFMMLGLLGLFFAPERRMRLFLYGLWSAYLLYGLIFDYHIATHDYYQLPLIPIVAVSLAPLGDRFGSGLAQVVPGPRLRGIASVVLLYGLLSTVWAVRNEMKSEDFRAQAPLWAAIGEVLGPQSRVVGLTQDYGSRLNYWGWHAIAVWPNAGDLSYHDLRGNPHEFEQLFDSLAKNRQYFLVTDFDELALQPELKQKLYSGFAIYGQAEDYVIFDLGKPLR